ncbi:MAG: hypothetical protein IKW90_07710 [Lachnospiraceae bacterium]|nr:hypothetical protein [Lachnospiraceae bacterium]
MKDYYYIKLNSKYYGGEPQFISADGVIVSTPNNIMIFDDIEKAVDYKFTILYMYSKYYDITIEQF